MGYHGDYTWNTDNYGVEYEYNDEETEENEETEEGEESEESEESEEITVTERAYIITTDGEKLYLDEHSSEDIYIDLQINFVNSYITFEFSLNDDTSDDSEENKGNNNSNEDEDEDEDEDDYVTFNAKFQAFEEGYITYAELISLISLVETNNTNNTEHVVNITYPEELSTSSIYTVTCEYDDDNYVSSIICTEITVTENTSGLLAGVEFKLYYVSDENGNTVGKWVVGEGNGNKSYTSDYTSATTYTTGEDGTISITGLKKGKYAIYEISIDITTNYGYYLEDQKGYISDSSSTGYLGSYSIGTVYCGYIYISEDSYSIYRYKYDSSEETKTRGSKVTFTYNAYNLMSGYLEITKNDLDTGEDLNNVSFKLFYAYDNNNNYVGIWVTGSQYVTKTYDTSTTYEDATTYKTTGTGKVTIKYLRLGTYYIYESKNNNAGYYLEDQISSNGLSGYSYDSETGLAYCGKIKISPYNDVGICTISIYNVRRIKISGYVWIDESNSKGTEETGGYNSLYDEPDDDYDGERLVYAATVSLYKKGSDTPIQTTTTGTNGTYIFNSNYDDSILYRDIKARQVLHKI